MASEQKEAWKTAITRIAENEVRVRGFDIADLMGGVSFGSAVYLILRGDLPNEATGRLLDAILVSSIDHGATPPSALAARSSASTGAPLNASIAAGLLNINRFHGGAIEECARQLDRIIEHARENSVDLQMAAEQTVTEMKADGRRMSGFGHRIHSADPRTARLFEMADIAGTCGDHVAAARAVEEVFRRSGKNLPINVDGAIGAVLADLGFDPSVMNGLFMLARVPGLIAHAIEERTTQRPMRRIDPTQHQYSGPEDRSL